jgi:hypothetical protein
MWRCFSHLIQHAVPMLFDPSTIRPKELTRGETALQGKSSG